VEKASVILLWLFARLPLNPSAEMIAVGTGCVTHTKGCSARFWQEEKAAKRRNRFGVGRRDKLATVAKLPATFVPNGALDASAAQVSQRWPNAQQSW